MKVICEQWSESQVQWAGDDPNGRLTVGRAYEVDEVESHEWYTKFHMTDDHGEVGQFNSVYFASSTEDITETMPPKPGSER